MHSKNRFTDISPTAENHFRLLGQAAVFRLIHYLRRLAETDGDEAESCLASYPFLAEYFDEMRPTLPDDLDWDDTLTWWEKELLHWEEMAPPQASLPLRRLARKARLSFHDRTALLLIGLVEDDIRFGGLFAALQEPLISRRMGQGLLEAILDAGASETVSRLRDCGLIRAENQNAPRAEWVLHVPLPLWDTLRGVAVRRVGSLQFRAQESFPPLEKLILGQNLRTRLLRLPELLASRQIEGVILRSMADNGQETLMGSLARALHRDTLFYERPVETTASEEDTALLGPLCLLTDAFPVLSLDPAPGETITLENLVGYNGPVGVLLPREGGCSGPLVERALLFPLPAPTQDERLRFWQQLLPSPKGTSLETLAARFRLPFGAIAQVERIASAYAALAGRKNLLPADVQQASRALNRQALDLMAQRLDVDEEPTPDAKPTRASAPRNAEAKREENHWRSLVVNPTTEAELDDLERRCRYREQLDPHLGIAFSRGVNPGVRALFHGPSGTGKTLAAKTLAALLQMDIYRVDLAAIVNKYVGETEKNLSRLLARAEELDVILLLDEGDSLMSGRTEVRSANDRYANLETNYLLQRLESYEGIVLVTTNAGGRIDTAFERRFDAVVHFSLPDVQERLLLWQNHLSATREVSCAYLEKIAAVCALTGGQIRNAALHAALLAASEHRTVTEHDIDVAIRREYRKAGAACPLPDKTSPAAFDPITAFLAETHENR